MRRIFYCPKGIRLSPHAKGFIAPLNSHSLARFVFIAPPFSSQHRTSHPFLVRFVAALSSFYHPVKVVPAPESSAALRFLPGRRRSTALVTP